MVSQQEHYLAHPMLSLTSIDLHATTDLIVLENGGLQSHKISRTVLE